MANDVSDTVRNSQSCSKERGTFTTNQHNLLIFPFDGPFELVEMDILGPQPRTKTGKRFILIITDRYSKLIRVIPHDPPPPPPRLPHVS